MDLGETSLELSGGNDLRLVDEACRFRSRRPGELAGEVEGSGEEGVFPNNDFAEGREAEEEFFERFVKALMILHSPSNLTSSKPGKDS